MKLDSIIVKDQDTAELARDARALLNDLVQGYLPASFQGTPEEAQIAECMALLARIDTLASG
jgi:hypothetical protein